MAEHSTIEWTDATWNPVTGCDVISPGCTNCYAMKLAGTRLKHHPSRKGLTRDTKAGPVWNGEIRLNHEWLTQPLQWKRPRNIFVCAHGDLFHEDVPDEFLDKVFAVMALAPHHTFQVLTKRADRMRAYFAGRRANFGRCSAVLMTIEHSLDEDIQQFAADWLDNFDAGGRPLQNVWLGVSVEDQKRADERRDDLHALANIGWTTFVSYEPAIGYVDWKGWEFLSWLISGGESGAGARPSHPDWHRAARDFCAAADVPFLFKQWGAWLPWEQEHVPCWKAQNGKIEDSHILFPTDFDESTDWDDGLWAVEEGTHAAFQRVGKKAAGRLLDGIEHNGMPAR